MDQNGWKPREPVDAMDPRSGPIRTLCAKGTTWSGGGTARSGAGERWFSTCCVPGRRPDPSLSPCVEAAGVESGWSVVRGVDVGRRRRSPLVYGCGQPGGPSRSPFPAVPRSGCVTCSSRRRRSRAISASAFMRRESCVETLSRAVVEDLGTTRPAHRTLWIPLLVVGRSVVVAVVDRVVPPALGEGAAGGRISCSK